MAEGRRRLSIRLGLEGDDKVRRALEQIGADGQRAMQRIERSGRGSGTALDALSRTSSNLQATMSGLGRSVGPVAASFRALVPLAGALSAAGFVAFTRQALDAVGGLGELAETMGVTTDGLQVMQFASVQAGVGVEELRVGLSTLSRQIGEAVGANTAMADTFGRLGVRVRDANGQVRSTEAVFRDVAEALSRVPSQAERVSIANRLMGESGARLLPILSQGARGLDEFARQARDAGAVLDAEMIAQADAASDAIARMEFAAARAGQTIAVQFADEFESAANAISRFLASPAVQRLTDLLDWLGNRSPGALIRSAILQGVGIEGPGRGQLEERLGVLREQLREAEGMSPDALEGVGGVENYRQQIRDEIARVEAQVAALPPPLRLELNRPSGREPAPPPGVGVRGGPSTERKSDAEKAAENEAQAIMRVTEALRFEEEQIGRTAREQAIASALRSAGIDEAHGQAGAIAELAGRVHDLASVNKALDEVLAADEGRIFGLKPDEIKKVATETDGLSTAILGGLSHALMTSAGQFEGWKGAVVQSIGHVITELLRLEEAARAAGNAGPVGEAINAAGGFFGNLFGGGGSPGLSFGAGDTTGAGGAGFSYTSYGGPRAAGGPVDPSKWYMVGERGPEPFVPNVQGTIIPNRKLGRGGDAQHSTVRVEINGAAGNSEVRALVEQGVAAGIARAAPGIVRQAGRHVQNERADDPRWLQKGHG